MQKRIFWMVFLGLDLVVGFMVPLMWSVILTFPIIMLSWWIAYRSGWFE